MTLKLTFLGHAGYLLETANHKVAIDPYLTDNPVAVMKAEELDCTHIVVTHGHFDHFADVPAIAKRTGATVVAPVEICEYLSSDEGGNHEKCEPGAPGGKIVTDFGFVAFVQAMHGSSFKGRYMGPACGVVVQIGGKKLYHAGDTALFSDMKLIGENFVPDVAILPVGDRFTMGPELATQAAELVGAPLAIPCHYGTWPALAQDIATFKPVGIEVRDLKAGESIELV